jgi:hypothetical protein
MAPRRKRASSPVNAVQGQASQSASFSETSGGDGTNVGASALRSPRYVTVRQAAEKLFLSDAAVRKLLTQKVLRRFKVCGTGAGRRTLLLSDEVDALVMEVK